MSDGVVFAGTKADRVNDRQVQADAVKFHEKIGAPYVECSALDEASLVAPLVALVRRLWKDPEVDVSLADVSVETWLSAT